MKRKLKISRMFITLILLTFALWAAASFIDVNMHNDIFMENYGEFANWNLFSIFKNNS